MSASVLIVDNYDSFTYNLAHAFGAAGARVTVHRNDAIDRSAVDAGGYDAIVLSPGPGSPDKPRDFGVCADLIRTPTGHPMLGVCLGMQGMAHYTGGHVRRAGEVVHGEANAATLTASSLWAGLPETVDVGRYHSLVVDAATLPPEWRPTAATTDGTLMAMDHQTRPWHGVQFHPESILTPHGGTMIRNFLAAHT